MMQEMLTDDIVMSSRIRLARNFKNIPFPAMLSDDFEAENLVKKVFNVVKGLGQFKLVFLKDLSNIDCLALLEKHLISKELIDNKDISAYITCDDEKVVIMLNEEDHIRSQCFLPGLHLDEAFEKINKIDDKIISSLPIAFSEKLGFLTACQTNLGTGLRASVMMFLPALTMTNSMENIIASVSKLGFTFRGVYGEGSSADGYIYQLSNQTTLGVVEKEIISSVKKVVLKICEMEKSAREILQDSKRDEIKDNAFRAYGILSSSYLLSCEEFGMLIARIKLGKCLGLIDLADPEILDKLLINAQPALLMKRFGKEMSCDERDRFRADYVSRAIKNQKI
ncbi:MAG: protein arginine kinase [Clostridia bacterium]